MLALSGRKGMAGRSHHLTNRGRKGEGEENVLIKLPSTMVRDNNPIDTCFST